MQLIGEAIRHQVFGKGIVTGWDQHMLTVCFSGQEKKFLYPDAFSKYLVLRDEKKQAAVLDVIAREQEAQAQQQQERDRESARISYLHHIKVNNLSQGVFDVADPEQVFRTWQVSTGLCLSGFSKGEPKVPDKMKPNSLCLLTAKGPGLAESQRRIVGLFMVREDFSGRDCEDGLIEAHPKYRLRLSREQQLPYWPLVTEDPKKQRWGNTTLKYLSIAQMEDILYKLLEKAPELKALYRYYCILNHLEPRRKSDA